MADNEDKRNEIDEEEEDFFRDLIEDEEEELDDVEDSEDKETGESDDSDEELSEEEQRRKNKNAEEARKRREAKAKAEKEAKAKAEADEKRAKEEAEAKRKQDEKNNSNRNKLGAQLEDFKKKYPDVDLAQLDKDKSFKKYIDGKLLGKKNFTSIYEDYLELRSDLSGKSPEDVERNYRRKAESSSGSSTSGSNSNPQDVYSQKELENISRRLPFMSDAEVDKVMEKFDKSLAFYNNKK